MNSFVFAGARTLVIMSMMIIHLTACAPNQKPDVLSIGGPFEFTGMDPAQDGDIFTKLQIAETLIDVNERGEFLPGLAASWEVSANKLIWTFHLRNGVVFHNGSPLDSAAVVNSLLIARTKPGVLTMAPVREIRAVGAETVIVELSEPYSPIDATLAHYGSQIMALASYTEDGAVEHLYGTGPYRIDEVIAPHTVEASRFDDYWGKAPSIPHISFLSGPRPESRALQIMSGQTDIIYTLDPASLDLLARQDDIVIRSTTIPRTTQIKLNSGHPFLNDARARRAISLALDRRGIATNIIRVPGSEANQLAPPFLERWHNPALPALDRNLDQARALLNELGWQKDESGMLVRDGTPFRLRMVTYSDRPELVVIATAIQAQLREVGIAIDVDIDNSSAIPASHIDGTLEMALMARNYGTIPDPLGVFIQDFGSLTGGEWGAMNWNDPELLTLIEQLKGETDPVAYRGAAYRISAILAEQMPVIPVTFYTQQSAVSARVRNFRYDPFERNYYLADFELSQE